MKDLILVAIAVWSIGASLIALFLHAVKEGQRPLPSADHMAGHEAFFEGQQR